MRKAGEGEDNSNSRMADNKFSLAKIRFALWRVVAVYANRQPERPARFSITTAPNLPEMRTTATHRSYSALAEYWLCAYEVGLYHLCSSSRMLHPFRTTVGDCICATLHAHSNNQ